MSRTRRFMRTRVFRWLVGLTALGLSLLAGYLWLRDSSLVSVEKVRVTGLRGSNSTEVRHMLESAAYDMTTLHVKLSELRQIVAPYPTIEDVTVKTSFPHELTIHIIPRTLVAVISAAGRKFPVSPKGKLLHGQPPSGELPIIPSKLIPSGEQAKDPKVLTALAILRAGSTTLARRVARVYEGPHGWTADLRKGPKLYFGDATGLSAKWQSATRLLADPKSSGAAYIDVQVPGRPAVG